jgi:8-oxo-dGTP pyrophosphatase MutT (NUDIX family)
MLSLAELEARVARYQPGRPPIFAGSRAAVAALLRDRDAGPEVLLMKRAAHPGDRWSGHVSFPGGREEKHDAGLLDTAIRETQEEVGVDLRQSARLIGKLDTIRAIAQGKALPLTITPFVFVSTEDAPLALAHEAESAFWLPLREAASGTLDGVYEYRLGPLPLSLPCWRYQGYCVWGLTYQMIRKLLSLPTG